ncbi:uncharacterized protein LOC111122348 [Crassostrea virginica]
MPVKMQKTGERGMDNLLCTSFQAINEYNQSHLVFDLYMAVVSGETQLVRNILLSHPDVDFNILVKGATVLSLSLYKRHFDIFGLLMRHSEKSRKMKLNICSKDHLNRVEPPIITACRMHFLEGVVALVNAGADIDAVDNNGHTALWVASRQQMPDLVEYLISNGASVNKTDRFNYTPLLTALTYRVSSIITKTLILHGSNMEGPKVSIMAQQTPLFWAAKSKNIEIVRLILCAGLPTSEIKSVHRALLMDGELDSQILALLNSEYQSPPLLRQICRRVVRNTVSNCCKGKDFIKHINALPLPVIMKQYLTLR